MKNYKPTTERRNWFVLCITIALLTIGLILIIVVKFTDLAEWLRTCGIVLCVISLIAIIWVVRMIVKNNIDRM